MCGKILIHVFLSNGRKRYWIIWALFFNNNQAPLGSSAVHILLIIFQLMMFMVIFLYKNFYPETLFPRTKFFPSGRVFFWLSLPKNLCSEPAALVLCEERSQCVKAHCSWRRLEGPEAGGGGAEDSHSHVLGGGGRPADPLKRHVPPTYFHSFQKCVILLPFSQGSIFRAYKNRPWKCRSVAFYCMYIIHSHVNFICWPSAGRRKVLSCR